MMDFSTATAKRCVVAIGLAAVLVAYADPAAAACGADVKKLAQAKARAGKMRAQLRKALLAGQSGDAVNALQTNLSKTDGVIDELAVATKGCKVKARPKKAKKKAAAPQDTPVKAQPPKPAGPLFTPAPANWKPQLPPSGAAKPAGPARVILTAEHVQPCAKSTAALTIPALWREGKRERPPGAVAAWFDRRRLLSFARSVGERIHEELVACEGR